MKKIGKPLIVFLTFFLTTILCFCCIAFLAYQVLFVGEAERAGVKSIYTEYDAQHGKDVYVGFTDNGIEFSHNREKLFMKTSKGTEYEIFFDGGPDFYQFFKHKDKPYLMVGWYGTGSGNYTFSRIYDISDIENKIIELYYPEKGLTCSPTYYKDGQLINYINNGAKCPKFIFDNKEENKIYFNPESFIGTNIIKPNN